MLKYLETRKTLLTVALAIVAGFVSAKFLPQGNPLVALPWGALAFFVAFFAESKVETLTLGACIGFVASYAYLWFDNTDKLTLSKIALLVFLIILPALFGLLCGIFCSWIGWLARKQLLKNS